MFGKSLFKNYLNRSGFFIGKEKFLFSSKKVGVYVL
jgi:hypothetical protein